MMLLAMVFASSARATVPHAADEPFKQFLAQDDTTAQGDTARSFLALL
jgi:hypothetical protein